MFKTENPYHIGVDFGTQSVRCGVIDCDGGIRTSAECFYKTFYPQPGMAEQDPLSWWSAFKDALGQCLNALPPDVKNNICSITLCATASTVLAVDDKGEPMMNAIMWMDVRAVEEAKYINEKNHPVLKYCGGEDSVEWMPPKTLWLKRNKPEIYKNSYKIAEQLDWLNFKLTGVWCGSICNTTCKWNYVDSLGGWQDSFYEEIGLGDFREKWPVNVLKISEPIGAVREELVREFGLPEGITVYQGGIDAHVNAIGLGVVDDKSMSVITGTSFCHIGFSKEPVFMDGIWGPYGEGVVPGYYCLEGGQVSAGSLTKWFIDTFSVEQENGENPYETMAREAESIPLGSEGLVILDFFQGNRTPYKDPRLKGVIYGLTLKHSRAHIYRAILEAVAMGTKNILVNFETQGVKIEKIVVSGGATKNRLWLQIISDCTGKEIVLNENISKAGILGCAMAGAIGSKVYGTFTEAADNMVRVKSSMLPDMERHAAYNKVFDQYLEIYKSLKHVMHENA